MIDSCSLQQNNCVRKNYINASVILTKLGTGFKIRTFKKQSNSQRIFQSIYRTNNLPIKAKQIFQEADKVYQYISRNVDNDQKVWLGLNNSLHIKVQINQSVQIVFEVKQLDKKLKQYLLKSDLQTRVHELEETQYKNNTKIFQLEQQLKNLTKIKRQQARKIRQLSQILTRKDKEIQRLRQQNYNLNNHNLFC